MFSILVNVLLPGPVVSAQTGGLVVVLVDLISSVNFQLP